MGNSGRNRSGDVAGTGELKAVAEQALRLGARALGKGRAWLNETWSNDRNRRDDMAQHQGRSGRESEARGQRQQDSQGRRYAARGDDESWMHDKHRQASNAGYADYAYDPDYERGREYGHASAGDYGREYAEGRGDERHPRQHTGQQPGARFGPRPGRDEGRGWRQDGAPQAYAQQEGARHRGERGLYGAYGPDAASRGDRGERYDDSGWRAGGFDERSQAVGWEDDRGDAPGDSPRGDRGGPRQGDPRHGYYVYGGESGGSGGRERLHDYDEFDPRRGRHDQDYRDDTRRMGEGYGRSSGYAGGFSDSAYGAGFEPNDGGMRSSVYGDPSAQRGERGGSGYSGGGYREQGVASYRGHGPRNYARSDERIAEELNERLTEDELIDARDIEVRCSQGQVVLEGEVADRWMKHRAEDIADACGGVKDVDNRIRVRGRGQGGEQDRGHAVLAAGLESSGRGQAEARGAQSESSSSSAQSASTPSSTGAAGRSAGAGAGSNPGTNAGTSGTSSSAGGTSQSH